MAMPDRAEPSNWGQKPRYGEFEIEGAQDGKPRLLGEGSFGKTFAAVRTDAIAGGVIEEHVAVKVLNPALLCSESRRFQVIQELVALTKFKHSNLIHYIRCGEDDGEVYYAMELCRGGDLSRLVRRYRVLPEKVAALIGLQVATGLREVHQRHRLVHRDIKPSNIMLVDELEPGLGVSQIADRLEEQEGLCRIVDFGLVNFALNLQEANQKFVGSPMYASPEQIGEQPVDGRSDIYSLGMTLWYLVQGKGPLLDTAGNDLKGVRHAMLRHTMPEEHEPNLPPHLSAEFRSVLAKMVAKKPEERYANAAEVQHALRDYLRTEAVSEEARFTVTRFPDRLASGFVLETDLPARAPRRSHVAQEKTTGERVKLTVLSEAGESPETEALAEQWCRLGELSRQYARRPTLLPIRQVVWAADGLAVSEDWQPHRTVAEVVKARAEAGQAVAFAEAMTLLRPIAEALDFLIEHGQNTVFLRGDEVWLTPLSGKADAGPDPLTPWAELQAHFSMLAWLGVRADTASAISSLQETLAESLETSDFDLHPVPSIARLVYFIMSGMEVSAAAQFTSQAYGPVANLRALSNDLIRDLLCRKNAWTHATTVLRDLCTHEGIVWQHLPPTLSAHRSTAAGGTSPSAHPSTPMTSGSVGESSRRDAAGGEKVCEIVSPGVVRSPYDPERRTQQLLAQLWVPSGRVRCQITQKSFRLPRKLDPLLARVVAPGIIQSPYVAEVTQQVPWEDWVAGGEIVCAESGRRIALPQGLPAPDGILPPQRAGAIISPYDGVTSIPIPPNRWEAGASVLCPATQSHFVLPKVLPALEALAEASRPGTLATPYETTKTWQIEPMEWVAGSQVPCPVSGKPLRLPPVVDRWPAPARLVDASRRLVSNPFRPGTTVEVPGSAWRPGATVQVPAAALSPDATVPIQQAGRTILLPADLPLLAGEVVEGRPGVMRSPYSGEIVAIPPRAWTSGAAVTCPRTQLQFLLPGHLPEWIPEGNISGLSSGKVRSPYEPFAEIPVPADEWLPNQQLRCPETGRAFRLPEDLPGLEGKVKPGSPGKVTSPFSGEVQDVLPDDWKPGQRLECAGTGRPFRLPAAVEEWVMDGEWVPGCPGRIRSPYHPHPELDLTAEEWRPRQVLTCPATQRRFRAPISAGFPTLALEKEAVQYALAEPGCTPAEAADALKRQHRMATAVLVQAVWERHDLETVEKRQSNVQTAEVLPDEPGMVRSPYGSRAELVVPPALWMETEASALCPESGRRFLLPAKRPPLLAQLVPGTPGCLISPYAPEEPFRISPDQWQPGRSVRCGHTSQPLQLPRDLPEWLPEGTLQGDLPGVAFSPYGRRGAVRIPASDWLAAARVTCLETGRIFVLPAELPLPTATVDENQLGEVVSPYSRKSTLRVPHRLWKPGVRLICPETKRAFLLPPTLPVWNLRPFPWKAVAGWSAAALIVVGGWSARSHFSRPLPPVNSPVVKLEGMKAEAATGAGQGSTSTQEGEMPPPPPPPRRVFFVGGLDIEGWPATKKDLPKSLRLFHQGKEVALKMENNLLTALLPAALDERPAAEVELQLPGWQAVKVALPTPEESDVLVKDRPRLARQRMALPASIIPEGGTDYEYLEASWQGRLNQEPDAVPPSANPVRLRIAKGEIERPLPTGIYDFTLLGGDSAKLDVKRHVWKAGVPLSSQALSFYTLPPSLSGEFLGLLFTVRNKDKQLEGGYFFSLTVAPKLAAVKALVNPLPIKGGEVISAQSLKADKDELGIIGNLKLTDPRTLEFDASLRMFDYHWTLKAEENGTRFMYGGLVEFNDAHLAQEKVRMEQMFREKARSARVAALAADRLGSIRPDHYRILYGENFKEAKQKAQYLMETYPDMKVKGSSIYFGLHSGSEVVRVVRLKNGDWDLQKDPR